MTSIPFCVIEKPYMIWAADVRADNEHFLTRLDADLYYRMAHNIIGAPQSDEEAEDAATDKDGDDQDRKDVSTLSRLLWHHGMETLVMLLGAYIQAPSAVHAYFLKSKTEDAVQMAGLLSREECPKYHHLEGAPFSLVSLLNGIHRCARWQQHDIIVERFARTLRNMLSDYVDEKHRAEYNSIKHGLRASHGRFALAVGIQDAPGIPAPPEAMQMVGFSRDASFFEIVKPLSNTTKQQSKINFMTEQVSVSWSLEKVLMELQLLSLLLHNTVSALRIVGGAPTGSVTFNKVADDEEFWEVYFQIGSGGVPTASFAPVIDARHISLATDKRVFDSYKRPQTQSRTS
jgi:hypothetical protein